MMNTADMSPKIAAGNGFVAALDEAGGSTPHGVQGLWNAGGRLVRKGENPWERDSHKQGSTKT
jgi:hypothetical protein